MAVYISSVQAATVENKIYGMIDPYTGSSAPTHEDTDGRGGYQCVASAHARDSIPTFKREAGMVAFVQNEEVEYVLQNNLITWTKREEVAQVVAGNLYSYITYADQGVVRNYEEYKWHDGRLETSFYLDSAQATIRVGDHLRYGDFPVTYFKTDFIRTPVVKTGSRDASGGINWGGISSVSSTQVRGVALSNSDGWAVVYVTAVGRWK